jgi:glucosamine--fructose-6-phosphate aminotransferase (isomerizing)
LSSPVTAETTLMFREAAAAGAAVRRQQARGGRTLAALAERLREAPPRAVVTLARGSSDNAATFARYLIERRVRVLTSSIAPSIASVYDAMPDLAGTMMLAISQSGRSPDLLAAAEAAKARGALVVALVNEEGSPLAASADFCLPLCAGAERSVAATKSFIATLAAIVSLIGGWTGDVRFQSAFEALPDLLDRAWALDWSPAVPVLAEATDLYVVGRGPGYAIAQEAALKIKETCGFHAEAFSAAEVRHGPMALVENGFPVLLLGQADRSLDGIAVLGREFGERGARLIRAGVPGVAGTGLPTIDADPLVQPILLIQSFYRLANALAVARGRDPDRPPHLAKVTETV